ncbi:MAG: DUF998 domain-containing protein [Flavobacteriaceae bacterium]
MSSKSIYFTGIFGVLLFISTTIIATFLNEDYNSFSQLISELTATGVADGKLLRWIGIIPSGILISVFSFLAISKFPNFKLSKIGFVGFGIFYGIATISVGVFPCDEGCSIDLNNVSSSQIIHSLSGLLTYIFVPLSLFLIGFGLLKFKEHKKFALFTLSSAFVSVIFVALFFNTIDSNFSGIIQRFTEAVFLFWIVICSIKIKNHSI